MITVTGNKVPAGYIEFLQSKIIIADKQGIEIDVSELHPSTKPHQGAIVKMQLELGRGLIAADCGMGKSQIAIMMQFMLYKRFGGKHLIVTELGASETFVNEDPAVGEGARLGIPIEYVTNTQDAFKSDCWLVCTNYERVRNGDINFAAFDSVVLDEGDYIKNIGSDTTQALAAQLKTVKYKWIMTATPSPNERLELVNYAHVLGICDRGQILTRFFKRNSVKAGELTLHEHHIEDYWMWVLSWAVFVTRPSDLGFDDGDYALPELEVIWHEVEMSTTLEKVNRDGQKEMFINGAASLPDAAKIKRESIDVRLAKVMEIMFKDGAELKDHFLIWHHLEDERKAINSMLKYLKGQYAEIFGSQPERVREQNIIAFTKGLIKVLSTKPSLAAVGNNFQLHCYREIWMGMTHSWKEFYQGMCRVYRFPQKRKVIIECVHTPEERGIKDNIIRKWAEHDEDRAYMRNLMRHYGLGLSKFIEEKKRTFFAERKEWRGDNYVLVCNDNVLELENMPDDCIDLVNTSFPFSNHYEYTSLYNDYGHNVDDARFKEQLGFMLPNAYRTLKPGRIFAVHLKNRIHYGSVTGLGFSIFHRFTHAMCECMESHGFQTMGFHYVPTDVVAENNQTYRLTFGEMQKDSSKMGSGIPEEIWIFRKPPTSTENAYADTPVKHNHVRCSHCGHEDLPKNFKQKESIVYKCGGCKQYMHEGELIQSEPKDQYTLAKWQIDADAFWKSSGNRYLTEAEIKTWGIDKLQRWWKVFNSEHIYDFDEHVRLLQSLDEHKKLSRSFTTLPLRSNTPYVWNDVNRMHGLNLEQQRRNQQNHICPQPFDEPDRIIDLYSEPGDWVGEPFGGLGTTGVRALKKGRKAYVIELNRMYAENAAIYMRETELKNNLPTLFDMLTT